MIKCAIIMLISLALESIINLNISFTSYLVPLFSLLSLILIYKFLKYNKKEYFIFAIVSGFIYDLVFTNFYVLNSVLFLLNSFIIYFYFKKMKYNLLNIILITIICSSMYNLMLFTLFNIFSYSTYSFLDFSYILGHFIIINVIYIILGYILLNKTKLKEY
mgnify:CR=1 FL=1